MAIPVALSASLALKPMIKSLLVVLVELVQTLMMETLAVVLNSVRLPAFNCLMLSNISKVVPLTPPTDCSEEKQPVMFCPVTVAIKSSKKPRKNYFILFTF